MGREPEAASNGRLRFLRLSKGLSREALAERAGVSADIVKSWETGRVRRPHPANLAALSQALDVAVGDLGFGLDTGDISGSVAQSFDVNRDSSHPSEQAQDFALRSHKFIPLFVGSHVAEQLRRNISMSVSTEQWLQCYSRPVENYGDSCDLYVWPFGVAMYHLIEELTPKSIAEVAVWRHNSYLENMAWAEQQVKALTGESARNEIYVLGTYWVQTMPGTGSYRDTLLRLLCVPEVLIERSGQAKPSISRAIEAEQELLRNGYDDAGIDDFGVDGVSKGLASWSGVVYEPLSPERALTELDLVQCELAAQAAWSYCSYLRYEVERGEDPAVPTQYGWKFLRGLRSRLTTERPQETPQHRSLREAVVQTSGLSEHLAQALEIMREVQGETS